MRALHDLVHPTGMPLSQMMSGNLAKPLGDAYKNNGRRLPSFHPPDYTSNVGWFDAASAASITSSSGLVSNWADLSGTGNDVAQSTGGNKPTTGANTINGLNVLTFDGSRILQKTVSYTSPNTILIVFQATDASNNNQQMFGNGGGGEQCTLNMQSLQWAYYDGGNAPQIGSVDQAPHVYCVVFNGASSKWWMDRNAAAVATASSPGTGTLARFNIGAANGPGSGFKGYIGEVAIWNAALSDASVNALVAGALAKWAL